MHVLHDDCRVKCLKLHDFVHQAATKTFVEWTNTIPGKGSLVTRVNDPSLLPLFRLSYCGVLEQLRHLGYSSIPNICYFSRIAYKVDAVMLFIFVHLTRI
jgi:hypothetical protein